MKAAAKAPPQEVDPVQELESVNKKIADMQTRRAGLIEKQEKARVEVIEREEALGAELLNGDAVQNTIAFIAQQRALIEGWNTAVKQADEILTQLEEERNQNARQIAIIAYEQEAAEAKKKFISCVRLLDQVNKIITGVHIIPPTGYSSPESYLVKNMVEHLQNGFDIYRTLIEWERIAPSLMQEALLRQEKAQ